MKHLFFIASLSILLATTTKAQLIVYNGTFDSVTTDLQGDLTPVNWTIPGGLGGDATTDAYTAPYAARIYNWNYTTRGEMFYGFTNSPDHTGMPLLSAPTELKGYYKYIPGNNTGVTDSAEVRVHLTLFDQLNGVTDTIATGHLYLTPTSDYTAFTVPIMLGSDSMVCDTLQIHFISSVNGVCDSTSDGTCCTLYIDELTIEFPNGFNQSIEAKEHTVTFDAATNRFYLNGWSERHSNWSIALVDVTGREVFSKNGIDKSHTDVESDLAAGIYVYTVIAATGRISGKVIVNR